MIRNNLGSEPSTIQISQFIQQKVQENKRLKISDLFVVLGSVKTPEDLSAAVKVLQTYSSSPYLPKVSHSNGGETGNPVQWQRTTSLFLRACLRAGAPETAVEAASNFHRVRICGEPSNGAIVDLIRAKPESAQYTLSAHNQLSRLRKDASFIHDAAIQTLSVGGHVARAVELLEAAVAKGGYAPYRGFAIGFLGALAKAGDKQSVAKVARAFKSTKGIFKAEDKAKLQTALSPVADVPEVADLLAAL